MDKRMITGLGIVALIMIAMPMMAIAQPSTGNKLPYTIKVISTQEVGTDLWVCYNVYDDIELLFYDCVITDRKATAEQIKSLLEYKTHVIYDTRYVSLVNTKITENDIKCWEYSEKISDWMWIC